MKINDNCQCRIKKEKNVKETIFCRRKRAGLAETFQGYLLRLKYDLEALQ